jgi:hypothetical protein
VTVLVSIAALRTSPPSRHESPRNDACQAGCQLYIILLAYFLHQHKCGCCGEFSCKCRGLDCGQMQPFPLFEDRQYLLPLPECFAFSQVEKRRSSCYGLVPSIVIIPTRACVRPDKHMSGAACYSRPRTTGNVRMMRFISVSLPSLAET